MNQINTFKTLTPIPLWRREGGMAKNQYDKKWQNTTKNAKKGGTFCTKIYWLVNK